MTVKIVEEISLTEPISLADMEQFVQQAKEMSVPLARVLTVNLVDGGDFRISARS